MYFLYKFQIAFSFLTVKGNFDNNKLQKIMFLEGGLKGGVKNLRGGEKTAAELQTIK